MALKEQQIINYLVAMLQSITIANGYNTDIGLVVVPWQDSPQDPNANANQLEYRFESVGYEWAGVNLRLNTLMLTARVIIQANDGTALSTLEKVKADFEILFGNKDNSQLGGLAQDLNQDGDWSSDYKEKADSAAGGTVKYKIEYTTDPGNPYSDLPDPAVPAVAFGREKTYAQLEALVAANGLVPEQDYILTNFRSKHRIPYTVTVNTGPDERIRLTAATANTFYKEITFPDRPFDIGWYEFVDSSPNGGDRGRITWRKDLITGHEMHEDWRAVKYRCWYDSRTDDFTSYTDLSEAPPDYPTRPMYVDVYPIFNSATPGAPYGPIVVGNNWSDGSDLSDDLWLGNNVFTGNCGKLSLGDRAYENHFVDAAVSTMLGKCRRNYMKDIYGIVSLVSFNSNFRAVISNSVLREFSAVEFGEGVSISGSEISQFDSVTLSVNITNSTLLLPITGILDSTYSFENVQCSATGSNIPMTVTPAGLNFTLSIPNFVGSVRLLLGNDTYTCTAITPSYTNPYQFEGKRVAIGVASSTGTALFPSSLFPLVPSDLVSPASIYLGNYIEVSAMCNDNFALEKAGNYIDQPAIPLQPVIDMGAGTGLDITGKLYAMNFTVTCDGAAVTVDFIGGITANNPGRKTFYPASGKTITITNSECVLPYGLASVDFDGSTGDWFQLRYDGANIVLSDGRSTSWGGRL